MLFRIRILKWLQDFCVMMQYIHKLVIVASCDPDSCYVIMSAATNNTDACCIAQQGYRIHVHRQIKMCQEISYKYG